MFSANENLALRQHKRRIVGWVEELIPEDALDLGTTVMAMQVSCKAPGCVPLETAIIIVFPSGSEEELIPGLPESKGSNYKTKILKPMADVTKEDLLEALPPAFPGGTRTMEKLCLQARDIALAQITQLFGEEDLEGRRLMAQYLQECLGEYIERGCEPPEWGEPFPPLENKTASIPAAGNNNSSTNETTEASDAKAAVMKGTGNFVIRRVLDDEESVPKTTTARAASTVSSGGGGSSSQGYKPTVISATRKPNINVGRTLNSQSVMSQLWERQEHAPGIRQVGCPCCDPDNPANVVDMMMSI